MEPNIRLRANNRPRALLVVRGVFIDSRGRAVSTNQAETRASTASGSHQANQSSQASQDNQAHATGVDSAVNSSATRPTRQLPTYRHWIAMTETSQPAAAGAPGGSRPDHVSPVDYQTYQAERAQLKQLLNHRSNLRKQLAQLENSIQAHESEYLEGTPMGNIITGFDNYTKGTTSAAAQRRRTGQIDQNRVFSRSSISYNPLNPEASEANSSTSTPGAPTPLSTSFAIKDKDGGGASNQPTPTSATEKKGPGGKKKKARASTATAAGDEESETDTPRETKKVRTNFGARK